MYYIGAYFHDFPFGYLNFCDPFQWQTRKSFILYDGFQHQPQLIQAPFPLQVLPTLFHRLLVHVVALYLERIKGIEKISFLFRAPG